MKKRVLWLSNEKWTREYEVPFIINSGYEVYCPKICGYGLGESNLSITHDYDSSLTIPAETLDVLNNTDLYCEYEKGTFEDLNRHFDIAFLPPFAPLIRDYVHHFNGIIILRFLGDEEGLTCTERLVNDSGYHLLYEINRIKDRFYFAYTCNEYIEDECDLFRGRGLLLPLPVISDQTANDDEEKQLMLGCPNVSLDEKANRLFQAFLAQMKSPFSVYGEQVVKYENHAELFIGGDYNNLGSAKAIIDPGLKSTLLTEPWAQALYREIPLIFVDESKAKIVLDKNSPGYCKDLSTAINKASRIYKGDKALVNKIVKYQNHKLNLYEMPVCEVVWRNALAKIESDAEISDNALKRKKKIGIILTDAFLGGVLSVTKRFVLSLKEQIDKHEDNTELIFAHAPSDTYAEMDSFQALRDAGITIREIVVKEMTKPMIARMLDMAGFLPHRFHGEKNLPEGIVYDDGIHLMMDCDYLINMTDRSGAWESILPVYPYAVVVHDYIERYLPIGETFRKIREDEDIDQEEEKGPAAELQKKIAKANNKEKHGVFVRYGKAASSYITNARNADFAFAMSQPTFINVVQFAMVRKNNVKLLPLFYEMLGTEEEFNANTLVRNTEYFLWSTNISKHKNHLKALKALNLYYKNGGLLKCVVMGYLVELMDPNKELKEQYSEEVMNYANSIRNYISRNRLLLENLSFEGYVTDDGFRELLKNSAFIFHPGFADNGNLTAVDAASFRVPTLSNDYPTMRYLSDYSRINCKFTDISDINASAEALKWMEQNYMKQAETLKYKEIQNHSLSITKQNMYETLSDAIGFNTRLLV